MACIGLAGIGLMGGIGPTGGMGPTGGIVTASLGAGVGAGASLSGLGFVFQSAESSCQAGCSDWSVDTGTGIAGSSLADAMSAAELARVRMAS